MSSKRSCTANGNLPSSAAAPWAMPAAGEAPGTATVSAAVATAGSERRRRLGTPCGRGVRDAADAAGDLAAAGGGLADAAVHLRSGRPLLLHRRGDGQLEVVDL